MKKIIVSLLLLCCSLSYGMEENSTKFIYSHGFGSAGVKSKRYIAQELLPKNTVAFNYQDAEVYIEPIHGIGRGLQIWKSCLGQDNDIQKLYSIVSKVDGDCVLYGESRGSSAILNYLGSSVAQSAKIKAAVLDSPFDLIHHVVEHRLPRFYLDKIVSPQTVVKWLPLLLRNYTNDGIHPIDSVKNISPEIPLLFICSAQDTEVPWKSSAMLYKILRENNHHKAHILFISGSHGWIMEGQHKNLYRSVVHAFYKYYGIEHNQAYAKEGEGFFKRHCQPTIIEIEHKLEL